jgi:L-rhamnose mutarotase
METPQSGYCTKNYGQPTKRYCQTLDLRQDPELIATYRKIHDEAHMWQEIMAGIRQVGILEMEIYLLGTRLFMIVETPVDFDWDEAMGRLSMLPRQAEWEAFTARFQATSASASSAEKWKLMERIFHLYK